MKKRMLVLAAAGLMLQAMPAIAEETGTVQVIGQTSGGELSVGESLSTDDYELKIENVQIGQNAGINVADPAHKYLCFDATVLNWMLEDLTVDPELSWSVVYDDDYRFSCASYQPSCVGTWKGIVDYGNEQKIVYTLEITEEAEDGTLTGMTMRMKDEDYQTANSSWNSSGFFDKTTGSVSFEYGDFIQTGNNRVSFYGTLKESVLEVSGFAEDGNSGEGTFTMTESDAGGTYNSVIAPLVEENYALCVLLPNQAAAGLAEGNLVLELVVGEDSYTVSLE
ncbi:MAG: hypothetical protein Q4F41_00210 [Eubacteriales bacterium]|nr:hypothetical protein [Eubacteriales bacterium]